METKLTINEVENFLVLYMFEEQGFYRGKSGAVVVGCGEKDGYYIKILIFIHYFLTLLYSLFLTILIFHVMGYEINIVIHTYSHIKVSRMRVAHDHFLKFKNSCLHSITMRAN